MKSKEESIIHLAKIKRVDGRFDIIDRDTVQISDIIYYDVEEGHCQSCYKTDKIYIDFDNAVHEGMSLAGNSVFSSIFIHNIDAR